RPGTFLAVAAGIGLATGRMTRGAKAGAPEHAPRKDTSGIPEAVRAEPPQHALTTPAGSPAPTSSTSLPGDDLPDLIPPGPGLGTVAHPEGPGAQESSPSRTS